MQYIQRTSKDWVFGRETWLILYPFGWCLMVGNEPFIFGLPIVIRDCKESAYASISMHNWRTSKKSLPERETPSYSYPTKIGAYGNWWCSMITAMLYHMWIWWPKAWIRTKVDKRNSQAKALWWCIYHRGCILGWTKIMGLLWWSK